MPLSKPAVLQYHTAVEFSSPSRPVETTCKNRSTDNLARRSSEGTLKMDRISLKNKKLAPSTCQRPTAQKFHLGGHRSHLANLEAAPRGPVLTAWHRGRHLQPAARPGVFGWFDVLLPKIVIPYNCKNNITTNKTRLIVLLDRDRNEIIWWKREDHIPQT